jgi:poly-gamma-glutamate synthesis protein (capsule biosynthesis protein)
MLKNYIYIFLFIAELTVKAQNIDTLKLVFIGDIMSHGPQLTSAYQAGNRTYDYSENFKYVDSIFHQADWVIGNLETTLGVKPFSGYPQFSAPPELAIACRNAGINVLATANNHSCDKRKKGIVKTIDILDSLQIKHLGTYKNKSLHDSLSPLLLFKNGIKIALLNYTYGTNGIPVPYPTRVNLINKKQMAKDIENTRKLNPDAVLVFLHWGNQYQYKASFKQLETEKFLHQKGIQYIIGSHPHVIQPIVYKHDSIKNTSYLTAYSLGNFISNQRKFPRDGSIILSLKFVKQNNKLQLISYKSIPIWVYKFRKNNRWHYEILPVENFILRPDYFIRNSDYQKMMRYYKHYQKILLQQ